MCCCMLDISSKIKNRTSLQVRIDEVISICPGLYKNLGEKGTLDRKVPPPVNPLMLRTRGFEWVRRF